MIETTETPEDIEKLLVEARAKLQAFEDGVDRKRLLARLKLQSPAHPILLFRALFLTLAVICGLAALTVLLIPLLNTDLARTLARFDAVVPAPAGVPGLPALLALLMACMLVASMMSTFAAYAMGRDAQMLPWEQKQHQKLVNEVTRLTTQKAVMERIRGTPAGARPRIATPVPVSLRDRPALATPGGIGRASALGSRFGPSTEPGEARGSAAMFGPPPTATPPGQGGLGGPDRTPEPARPLFRATPEPAPRGGSTPEPSRSNGSRLGGGAATRGGTPLGAAPRPGNPLGGDPGSKLKAPRLAAPVGFPGTPDPADRGAAPANHLFGTPPPVGRSGMSYRAPEENGSASGILLRARSGFAAPAAGASAGTDLVDTATDRMPGPTSHPLPRWRPIDEPWLAEAISRAEAMARSFPEQAHLEFSQETHLPFTLVIARATPAMAMRAMLSYVEFLASILTPPRGRIELNNVPQLDRNFHDNVAAALEPYFGDRFEVEPEIGRVEIVFKEPDPSWQDHPILPME